MIELLSDCDLMLQMSPDSKVWVDPFSISMMCQKKGVVQIRISDDVYAVLDPDNNVVERILSYIKNFPGAKK